MDAVIPTLQLRQKDLGFQAIVCKTAQLGSVRARMWTKDSDSKAHRRQTVIVSTTAQAEGHHHTCDTHTTSSSAVAQNSLSKVVWINCGWWPRWGRLSCNDDM